MDQYYGMLSERGEDVELPGMDSDTALSTCAAINLGDTQPFAILGQSGGIAKGLQLPIGRGDQKYPTLPYIIPSHTAYRDITEESKWPPS